MIDFEKMFLLGVGFTNATEQQILEFINTGLQKSSQKYYIVTPNPELLVIANNDKRYKDILNRAKLALPDGTGVMWGAWLMGKPLKQRITGVGFVKSLCKYVSKRPITVGFLGAGPGVAVKTAECLKKKYPGLRVAFTNDEWSFEGNRQSYFSDDARQIRFRSQKPSRPLSESLSPDLDEEINKGLTAFDSPQSKLPHSDGLFINHGIDILFVAFGSPKQEIWISQNLDKLPVKVVVGVGGAFDLISGKVKRAPVWVQKIGFEWLFRLTVQPWRIKRQLSLITFVFLVLKEKFLRK